MNCMNRNIFTITVLASLLLAPSVQAATQHGQAVFAVSNQVLTPQNALGAADGQFADFLSKDANITIDFGQATTSDVTMNITILQFGAGYRAEFLSKEFLVRQTVGKQFPVMTPTETISYTASEPYQYLRITSTDNKPWRLDAVTIDTETAAPLPEEPGSSVETPITEGVPETPSVQGLVIKLVDDGNPATTVDSAVYIVGEDEKRHVFPSATVYESWFEGFDELSYIDPEHLSGYELGATVPVRAGTYLVKLSNNPKVYAVEPGGVLRWVMTEELAETLYGAQWNTRVRDIPDVLFNSYTIGDPIGTALHPTGSVGVRSNGQVVYMDNNTMHPIPGKVLQAMRLRDEFFVPIRDEQASLYKEGVSLAEDPSISYPF